MEKMYLNDLMLEKELEIKKGKLNLVVAPTGSGKTTWCFETLVTQYPDLKKIIYLVDTNMLEESMLDEHEDILNVYDPDIKDDLRFDINLCGNKITVMSYCKFGLLMKNREDLLDYLDLIMIDEAHNLVKYAQMSNEQLKKLADIGTEELDINKATKHLKNVARTLAMLPKIKEKCDVVMMTATPERILNYQYINQNSIYDVLGEHKDLLRNFKNEIEVNFAYIKNIYRRFKKIDKYANKKILIYSQRISTCQQVVKEFSDMGYNAMAIWSLNNKDNEMTDEQKELRTYLIENKTYPDNLDVLVINSAYETGWNLRDKKVQIVIANTSEVDSIVQSRGRVRHDIEELYINAPAKATIDKIELHDRYLDRKLFAEDKDELCYELDIRNEKGRIVKWTTISNKIIKSGYRIKDSNTTKNGKKRKYTVISKIENLKDATEYIEKLLEIKLTDIHIAKINEFMSQETEFTVKFAIEKAYNTLKYHKTKFEDDNHKFNMCLKVAKEKYLEEAQHENKQRERYIAKQELNNVIELSDKKAEYKRKSKEITNSRLKSLW